MLIFKVLKNKVKCYLVNSVVILKRNLKATKGSVKFYFGMT